MKKIAGLLLVSLLLVSPMSTRAEENTVSSTEAQTQESKVLPETKQTKVSEEKNHENEVTSQTKEIENKQTLTQTIDWKEEYGKFSPFINTEFDPYMIRNSELLSKREDIEEVTFSEGLPLTDKIGTYYTTVEVKFTSGEIIRYTNIPYDVIKITEETFINQLTYSYETHTVSGVTTKPGATVAFHTSFDTAESKYSEKTVADDKGNFSYTFKKDPTFIYAILKGYFDYMSPKRAEADMTAVPNNYLEGYEFFSNKDLPKELLGTWVNENTEGTQRFVISERKIIADGKECQVVSYHSNGTNFIIYWDMEAYQKQYPNEKLVGGQAFYIDYNKEKDQLSMGTLVYTREKAGESVEKPKAKDKTLPQTGENAKKLYSIVGVIVVALAVVFIVIKRKKTNND